MFIKINENIAYTKASFKYMPVRDKKTIKTAHLIDQLYATLRPWFDIFPPTEQAKARAIKYAAGAITKKLFAKDPAAINTTETAKINVLLLKKVLRKLFKRFLFYFNVLARIIKR